MRRQSIHLEGTAIGFKQLRTQVPKAYFLITMKIILVTRVTEETKMLKNRKVTCPKIYYKIKAL